MAIRDFEEIMPDLHPDAYVDESALVIGDVVIGADSSVWPFTVIRGDVNAIRIGANTNIQDNSVLHVTHDGPHNPGGYALKIGDNVTVGHRVILHGCTIEDNCLIGMGATVMDGAVVHEHTILGAGALVTSGKKLESGLWLGSPARKVRELSDEERESIVYSAQHYVRLKNRHQLS
ncbi:gamma carbonic anhydrase family protein [Thiohalophilus sp.]|uniref:gamma carbonic anhydrase family protein n=1 Tax=Thiohalophilus sp. TaxID=3028392 RepID=UPI0039757A83